MRYWLVLGSLFLVQCSWNSPTASHPPALRKLASGQVLDKSGYLYDPKDRSCDGFPRLQVETLPGTCLGLVLPRDRAVDPDSKKPLVMPRTLAQVPGTQDFLLVDMGGWKDNNGSLYWLRRGSDGQYSLKNLKSGLNKPHGLRINALDGYVYLGETQRISRFHFTDGKMSEWETVVGYLPRPKGDMHPLTQFTFDPRNGDMFLNIGAPTDHCYVKNNGTYSSCPEDSEDGMGTLNRIPGEKLKNIPAGGITQMEVTASGLRNSMAMVVHPSGTLLQGENGRDFPELEEPYEEINAIDLAKPGFHYGWPYCYDFHGLSPEWKFPENKLDPLRSRFDQPVDCTSKEAKEPGEYQPPWALMPPHVAPLHAAYYDGQMFNELKGKLILTWHGYQPTGHRLVAYNVDDHGRPVVTNPASSTLRYAFDTKGGCPVQRGFKPAGGADRLAPYTEVISRWDQQPGQRPRGAPVGFTVASDGSIWIAEDKENRTVVRLARYDGPQIHGDCDTTHSEQNDPRIQLLAWRNYLAGNAEANKGYLQVREKLAQKYCTGCHGNFEETDIGSDIYSKLDFFVKNEWFVPHNPKFSRIYQAITQSGDIPAMPPADKPQFFGTAEGEDLTKMVANWITSLPEDVGANIKRLKLKDMRRFRDKPDSKAGNVCGQYDAGTTVYADTKNEIRAGGFVWVKTFVVPGDSRLFKEKCQYPVDGVFYMALRAQ